MSTPRKSATSIGPDRDVAGSRQIELAFEQNQIGFVRTALEQIHSPFSGYEANVEAAPDPHLWKRSSKSRRTERCRREEPRAGALTECRHSNPRWPIRVGTVYFHPDVVARTSHG